MSFLKVPDPDWKVTIRLLPQWKSGTSAPCTEAMLVERR